jgi:hypothetical protein
MVRGYHHPRGPIIGSFMPDAFGSFPSHHFCPAIYAAAPVDHCDETWRNLADAVSFHSTTQDLQHEYVSYAELVLNVTDPAAPTYSLRFI